MNSRDMPYTVCVPHGRKNEEKDVCIQEHVRVLHEHHHRSKLRGMVVNGVIESNEILGRYVDSATFMDRWCVFMTRPPAVVEN